MKALTLPIGMGAAMGAMMVWMIHNGSFKDATLGFVLAHIAVLAFILGLAFVGASWTGIPLRAMLERVHRPSRKHGFAMIGGMVGAAALVCAICATSLIEMR